MLDTIYTWVGSAVIVLICGAALWKGDRLEQWGGGLCFLAWLGSLLLSSAGIVGLGFLRRRRPMH